MHALGKIVRLQLQRRPLKRGEGQQRVYDPAPIIAVPQLTLTPMGACALAADGSFTVDVHNAAHPQTRNNSGANPISFLFTGHYDAMQNRFGKHLDLGCAGESILIETDNITALEAVRGGITINTKNGPVVLTEVVVARPCSPFTAFALGSTERPTTEAFKSALQFLDDGMRGYYCRFGSTAPAVVSVGDEVFAR